MKRSVLVTGANRGLGLRLSEQLAASGHKVFVTSRNLAKVEAAIAGLVGDVTPLQLDITRQSDVYDVCDFLRKEGITLNVLVNNAGLNLEPTRLDPKPLNPFESPIETIKESMDVNFFGSYTVTRALFPFFDFEQRVDIINVSSGMGCLHEAGPGVPGYRIAKAAMNFMTVWLNAEFTGRNVFVNSACTGYMRTVLGGLDTGEPAEEALANLMWIIQKQPDIRGKFLRNCQVVPF